MSRDSCPSCGQGLGGDEQFCPECGQDLSVHTCPDCGTSLDGDDQFCPGCGSELDSTPREETETLTCRFTFDVTTVDFTPPDPESTARDYATHALNNDEIEDGVWSCDRSVAEDNEHCLFHSTTEATKAEFATAMADRLSEADSEVSIVGATVPTIDLSGQTIDTRLDLRHTTVTGDVIFEGTTIRKPVILARSHIDGDVILSEAELTSPLNCEGTTVAGSLYGSDASFTQADFAGSEWGGTLNFTDANFNTIDFSDARFNDQAFFQGMSVSNEAQFAQAWLSGTHFNSAYFGSGISFRNAHFSGKVTLNEMVCDGTGMFDEATFMREVSFDDATFSQRLHLMEAKFYDDVRFDGVNGDISTFDTEFNGSVSGKVSSNG